MRELYEFRIWEEYAPLLFRSDEFGSTGLSRKALISAEDPKMQEIRGLHDRLLRESGKSLFSSWDIYRTYSRKELDASQLFKLRIRSVFEPAGEECGTVYDETTACPVCQSGARQVSPLYLPFSRIPKTRDLSETIAGEMVVSRRLVEAFRRHGITGAEFEPVRSKRSKDTDPADWFQMLIPSATVQIVSPTRTGIKPFDEDPEGQHRCSRGDLIGLNLLSEVSVAKDTIADLDVQASSQFVGLRRGLLRPQRLVFLSQRVRQLIEAEGLKGAELEVAYDV